MSYEYRGRYTHNAQEYHRWRSESDAEELRRTNSSLQGEANRLRSELSSTHQALRNSQNDVREVSRQQAKLEQRQSELAAVQNRIAQNQQAFEARTRERERELEIEIRESEERADEKISELRQETEERVAAVQAEVDEVRQDLAEGLDEVRAEVEQTREYLEEKVGAVRRDFEAERQRRIEKEKNQATHAVTITHWIESRLAALTDLDALGLTIERTRTQQHLERTREILNGDNPEMAMPVAETAFASYQTAYLERERKVGVMEGVAGHVQELAEELKLISQKEKFRIIFKAEAAQIDAAVTWLQEKAEQWQTRRQWSAFELEREKVVGLANQLLTRALELDALVPSLLEQLQGREQRLKEAASAVAAIMGKADKFEMLYANPDDVKSPRLLRGHIGTACVDTYLDLDGTYRVDAYGFGSSTECGGAAERMGRKLAEQWHVAEERVDAYNREQPVVAAPQPAESWRSLSSDFAGLTRALDGSGGKG
jgi:uncharacterized phage infection (PIP) family protein YhgE